MKKCEDRVTETVSNLSWDFYSLLYRGFMSFIMGVGITVMSDPAMYYCHHMWVDKAWLFAWRKLFARN